MLTPAVLAALLAIALPLPGAAAAAEPERFEVIYIQDPSLEPQQASPPDPLDLPRLHSNESSRGKLFDQWFLYHAARPGGDPEEADRLFRDLVLTFKREGFLAEPRVAGAFVYEGYQALEGGDADEALALFHKALVLAPHSGPARAGIARALRGGGSLAESVSWSLQSLPPATGDWGEAVVFGANLVLILGLGGAIFVTAATALLALRHQARARHDLQERFSGLTGRELAAIGATALFLFPAFLWQGPVWLLAFWLAFLFPYFGRVERGFAVLALGALFLAHPAARLVEDFTAVWWDPRVEEVLALADGGYSRESVEAVVGRIEAAGPDLDLQAILAQVYSDGGFSNEAYAQYREILDARPDSAWVFNNLGNLYLRSQQFGPAMQNYRKAMEADPLLVEPYYNLHIAHLEQFQIEEAEEMLHQAQMLAPERTSRWVEEGKKHPWLAGVMLPVDIRVPRGRLVREAMQARSDDAAGAGTGGGSIWLQASTVAGGLGLIGLVFGTLLRRKPVAGRCNRCGRIFCRRCQKGRSQRLCSQCHNLMAKREALSVRNRAAKVEEIARFEARGRRHRRLANLVLPGSGHLLGGRTLLGLLLLLAWCITAVAIASRNVRIPAVEVPYALSPGLAGIVAVALLAAVWLTANLGRSDRKV